jgi:hypothetical protein
MSRIFDFIKGFFGGLFSFLGGLLGGSKQLQESSAGASENGAKVRKSRNSGYFLELDDARSVSSSAPAKQPAAIVEAPAKVEKPKAAPATAAPASSATPAKVEPPKPVANPLNLPQPTVTTFAPDYLSTTASTNGRRRPGANMNYFLDLARQVKTSS